MKRTWFLFLSVMLLVGACSTPNPFASPTATSVPTPLPTPTEAPMITDCENRFHARDILESPLRGAVVDLANSDIEPPPEDGIYYPSVEDFQALRDLGANVVMIYTQYLWSLEPPYQPVESEFEILASAINNASQVDGLSIMVGVRNGPGRNDLIPQLEGDLLTAIYDDPATQDAYISMLQDMVVRFGGNPHIIAWETMIEPTPTEYFGDEFSYEERPTVGPIYPESVPWWEDLSSRFVTAIRELDPCRAIVVESVYWGGAEAFIGWKPLMDDNIIYTMHTFEPYEYANQYEPPYIKYPYTSESWGDDINATWLDAWFAPVALFQEVYDVPIMVGEFGGVRWVPGMDKYMHDQVDAIERRGWSWLYYAWIDETSTIHDAEGILGPRQNNRTPDPFNSVILPVTQAWQLNE